MNGIHDMGGMQCMGPVVREADEPVFHTEWERRVFGVMLSLMGGAQFSVDSFRYAIERMRPAEYLETSYYEHWLHAMETLLRERGMIDGETDVILPVDQTKAMAAKVLPARLDVPVAAGFKPGDAVVTRNIQPLGHTRLPRYVRGKRGTVMIDHGVFLFPDTYAVDGDPKPQHVYSVRFSGPEIWGEAADPNASIRIDMFEDYLVKA